MSIEDKLVAYIKERYGSVLTFCQEKNIPQSSLATALKRGLDHTSISTIIRLCDALSISVDALSNHEIVDKTIQVEIALTQEELDLVKGFKSLNLAGKERVMEYLHLLGGKYGKVE